VSRRSDPDYETLRRSLIWNRLIPDRRPSIIVRVATESDAVEAVRFARANRIKVAVRGGGHNWVGFSLCDESLLLDLGGLDQVSIDANERRATVGPATVGGEFNQRLAAHGLAFPVGHCPTVPLSGFLLNGGIGWNFGGWGPACFSVESARVVTADGNLVTASENQNFDLLWAIRGGGPGFFGVVTQYGLKLYPAPRAITSTIYYLPLQCAEEAGAWAGAVAGSLPKQVELAIFFAPAPPPLAAQCAANNGFVCVLSATAFVDTADEAAAALEKVNRCPLAGDSLQSEVGVSTPLETLLEMGGMLWPEGHRYLADTIWTNSPPGAVMAALSSRFTQAPSPKSQATIALSTGGNQHAAPRQDGAYSMTGDALMLCYAIWERPEDDAVNGAWHRAAIADLDRYAIGHYVGESDIVTDPRRAEKSYSQASWEKLSALRRKYDPDSLFRTV
jgi:FAD/FMN-containing dehydrogenase